MKVFVPSSQPRFALFAWFVLLYNLPVIVWGAWVRASFSGDGCGANWPTCNGRFIPQNMPAATVIEYTHRMMTSVDVFLVAVLFFWAFAAFPRRHAVRRYASLSLIFLFIEALLGAGLVLFRYVAKDQSAGRVWYLSAHLVNTMLLLAALTATAWLAYTKTPRLRLLDISRSQWTVLAITIFVCITGAVTALGDTLFPSSSLASGMQRDFTSASSLLLRLRIVHPLIAVLGAAYIVWIAASLLRRSGSKAAALVIIIVIVQIMAGMLNLALLAPVPMQLTHLLLADLLWISVVILLLETTARSETRARPSIGVVRDESKVLT